MHSYHAKPRHATPRHATPRHAHAHSPRHANAHAGNGDGDVESVAGAKYFANDPDYLMDECDGRELIRAVRAAIDPSGASKSSRGSGGKSSVDKSSGTGHGEDGNGSGGDGGGGFALSNGDEECGSDDEFADEYHAMQILSHAPYFEAQLNALRTGVIDALGEDFDAVYSYLLHARSKKVSDATIQDFLQSNYADRLDYCFLCDYLVREHACCLFACSLHVMLFLCYRLRVACCLPANGVNIFFFF
jgi:hypothetical protein